MSITQRGLTRVTSRANTWVTKPQTEDKKDSNASKTTTVTWQWFGYYSSEMIVCVV